MILMLEMKCNARELTSVSRATRIRTRANTHTLTHTYTHPHRRSMRHYLWQLDRFVRSVKASQRLSFTFERRGRTAGSRSRLERFALNRSSEKLSLLAKLVNEISLVQYYTGEFFARTKISRGKFSRQHRETSRAREAEFEAEFYNKILCVV